MARSRKPRLAPAHRPKQHHPHLAREVRESLGREAAEEFVHHLTPRARAVALGEEA